MALDSWVTSRVWLWQTALSSAATGWESPILTPCSSLPQRFCLQPHLPKAESAGGTTRSQWSHAAQVNDLLKALDGKCFLFVPEELQFGNGIAQVKLHSLAQEFRPPGTVLAQCPPLCNSTK